MKRIWVSAVLGTVLAGSVCATEQPPASQEVIESVTWVHGQIVLGTDGAVQAVTIDDGAKLGVLADFVRRTALAWRFEPVQVNGQPVTAKSTMHVRIAATPQEGGNIAVEIRAATFGDTTNTSQVRWDAAKNAGRRIQYPIAKGRMTPNAVVYLVLHVDRQGHVTDSGTERVDMSITGTPEVTAKWRAAFSDSALKSAQRWTFIPPTTGPLAKEDGWIVHLPVLFCWPQSDNGIWSTYATGPAEEVPWLDQYRRLSDKQFAAGAMSAGEPYTEGTGPQLLTPLKSP